MSSSLPKLGLKKLFENTCLKYHDSDRIWSSILKFDWFIKILFFNQSHPPAIGLYARDTLAHIPDEEGRARLGLGLGLWSGVVNRRLNGDSRAPATFGIPAIVSRTAAKTPRVSIFRLADEDIIEVQKPLSAFCIRQANPRRKGKERGCSCGVIALTSF
jgi:hypothetical protein